MTEDHLVKVTLVRHGESVFDRYQHVGLDTIDCPLTHQGKLQSRKLNGEYHLIILSPMKRCFQTLIESRLAGHNVEFSKLVREYRQHLSDFLKNEKIKIETEEKVLKRVAKFKNLLQRLKERNPQMKTICVISHANFIWYLSSKVDKETEERSGTWLKNCESYEFSY